MALKATIFKAELQVSDLDRSHFATHALTIARHPSETDERMMVRVLAFALDADERLAFGRGLSAEDEADLLRTERNGELDLWIDVGLPEERDLRRACGRARSVKVYIYGRGAAVWWRQNEAALARLDNLAVIEVPEDTSRALGGVAARTMKLDCTIQEGQAWLSHAGGTLLIEPLVRKAAAA